MSRKGWMEKHPLHGTCSMCDQALGNERLIRRRGEWLHRACWLREKGE